MHKNGVAILNWHNRLFQYEVMQKFYILKMGIIKKAVMKVSFHYSLYRASTLYEVCN